MAKEGVGYVFVQVSQLRYMKYIAGSILVAKEGVGYVFVQVSQLRYIVV